MAKPKIEPDTLYRVHLTKSVRIGRLIVNPAQNGAPNPKIRGDALALMVEQDADAVANYEAI